MIRGWDRGLVDGDYTMDDAEGWTRWADGIAAEAPELTLCQLLALTERGSFDGDYLAAAEEEA